jgi:competence protein ComEC
MPDRVSAEQHLERLRFRRAPLAAAALCFALGILLARLSLHETAHLVLSLAALALIAVIGQGSRIGWLPLAALWIVLGIAAFEWQPTPPDQSALLADADNLSRTVRGHVLRVHRPAPQPAEGDADPVPAWEAAEDVSYQHGQPMTLDLAVDEIEQVTPDTSTMVPIHGGIRVSVYEADESFHPRCGDRLEAPLRLKPPERFRTPGSFDDATYELGQGIVAHASVAAKLIAPLGPSPPTLRCRLYAAQAWASERLIFYAGSPTNQRLPALARFTEADALMLNAMLFGDRSGLSRPLRTGFERTGTFHLFVVSGLHIALVAAGLYWLLRRLRAPLWLATLFTLCGTSVYAAFTGFGQPAQRALTMTAVFLLARMLSRDRDSINALGAAVLVLLMVAPASLFDASFQMTVLVIVAIGGIAIPLAERTPIRHAGQTRLVYLRPRRIFAPRSAQLLVMLELWGEAVARILPLRWTRHTRKLPAKALGYLLRAAELTLISLVAELVMVLPMAVYFHRLPVFSVPANLVVLPAIGLLVPAAILTFTASLLSAKLALLPAAVTALLLHSVTFTINRLSGLRGADVRIPGPALWIAIAAVAAWLVCIWLVRRSGLTAWAAALVLPLFAVLIVWPEPPRVTPGALEVTALDVGQGDSILAVGPSGDTMLIDAGGPIGSHGQMEAVSAFDVGEQVVAPYLWSRRLRHLDILVLTHAHSDHMGGMPAVLADLHPRELWVGVDSASPLYRSLLVQAAALHVTVRQLRAGDRVPWGAVQVDVLAPAARHGNASAARNDDSLVLHLEYGKASVLLEGDAERPSEDAMLAAYLITPVTLLKVGHHGSRTSSNPEFLAAAQPREAVISVGRNNPFGHPRDEVIERFAEAHTRLFRTDLHGTTTFLLTPDGRVR